jgi:polyhydroxyalkanoate synthase subunit PhaC
MGSGGPLATSVHSIPSGPLPTEAAQQNQSTQLAEVLDRSLHYWLARSTLRLSTVTIGQAYADWALHLAISAGKQLQLTHKGVRKSIRLVQYVAHQCLDRDAIT